MSHFTSELAELVDRFCEGDITAQQAARLEALVAGSEEARKYLLDCFQVHGELAWEFGRESAEPSLADAVEFVVPGSGGGELRRKRLRGWAFALTAVALLVAVTLGLTTLFRGSGPQNQPRPASIAHLEQARDVRWCDEVAPATDAPLPAGSKLAFRQGLLEVVLDNGVRVILQGPAEVELQSQSSLLLLHGSLTAEVPVAAHGFAVHTPGVTVVDRGTRFGVACQAGQTDVEVFLGSVLVRLDQRQAGGGPQELPLLANTAVRVSGVPGQGALKVAPLAAGSRHFVQSLAGSAAQLQALAGGDSHLIHFYPFEGVTTAERLRDRRGNLDLHEVTMRDGGGGGELKFTRTGPDPSIQVVAPCRGEALGGARGRGLQSQSVFLPPASMTVELLVNISRVDKNQEGFIACAVATRHDLDRCGFLVTAVRDSELTCLFDGGAEWLPSGFKFNPSRWYYVASTFRVNKAETEVNAFAADLSEKSPTLRWVVRNRLVQGVPASGPLGIGSGFDGQVSSAYPWPGQLGLVAIYDTLLDRQTLENHFRALSPQARLGADLVPAKN